RLPDGRMNLLVTGASRFRLVEEVGGKPYRQARVEYLTESDDQVSDLMRHQLVAAFRRYAHRLKEAGSVELQLPDLPIEPELLAYLVAATIDAGVEVRQQLLEAPTVRQRMALELATLRREDDLLRRRVLPVELTPAAFSRN